MHFNWTDFFFASHYCVNELKEKKVSFFLCICNVCAHTHVYEFKEKKLNTKHHVDEQQLLALN